MAQNKSIGNVVLQKTLPTLISLAMGSTLVLLFGILLIIRTDIKHRHQDRIEKVITTYEAALTEQTRQLQIITTNNFVIEALASPTALTKYLLNSYLDTLNIGTLQFAEITVVNPKGIIFATNNDITSDSELPIAKMSWFNEVLVQQKSYQNLDVNGLVFVTPIISNSDVIGVLIADFENIEPFLSFNFESSMIVITNQENRILYTSVRNQLSPFTILDWTLLPEWRIGHSKNLGVLKIVSIEGKQLFFKDFYRLFGFALSSILFIFVSSLLSARAAGKLAAATIDRFLESLEVTRTNNVIPDAASKENEAFELKGLREEFEDLLLNLRESNLSKERVSAMMNSLNDLLVVFDLDGNIILSNTAFDSFVEKADIAIENLLASIFFNQNLETILDVNLLFTPIEKHYLPRNNRSHNRFFAVNWTRHQQINAYGQVTGVTFVGMDTTKSTELEAELKLKDAAIDSADSGIILLEIMDHGSRIIYANKGAINLIGTDNNVIFGASLSQIAGYLGDAKLFKVLSQATQLGESIVKVIPKKQKDGNVLHLEIALSPVNLPIETQKRYYLGILKDATDQQLTAQLLIEAKQKAEESAQMKSSFLASMSHEIRTPMNGVIGMLDILNESVLNEQQQNYVSIAQNSAESLLSLINDILDFSKVEAGKLTLEEIDFNLSDMLDGFVDSMAHHAISKNLELVLDSTDINQLHVVGDPGRLRQILTNLVGNAIKFTARGEIVIHASLTEVEGSKQQLTIKVTDTGIGIPHEKQAHLFDPFTQVDGTHKREQQGTGLGLAIVRQLCEAMHGHVWINSDGGRGSTFGFQIQLSSSDRTSPIMPPLNTINKKVLVIDDNETNRKVMCKQLEKWQIQATACDSATQALTLLEPIDHGFNAAIVDMNMPGMDGEAFGRQVKDLPQCRDLKLILMTSISQRGDAKHFAKMGFAGYFPKPATTSDIIDALSVLFDDGKALSEATPLVTQHYVRSLRREHTFNKAYRILLVEDNPVNQMISKKYIQSVGLQPTVAQDGAIAIKRLFEAEQSFDLILMDCQMPVLDGFEATRKIRTGEAGDRYLNIPIIAMTANAMKGDRERCLEVGMDDYISKPLRRDVLVQTLKSWLGRL